MLELQPVSGGWLCTWDWRVPGKPCPPDVVMENYQRVDLHEAKWYMKFPEVNLNDNDRNDLLFRDRNHFAPLCEEHMREVLISELLWITNRVRPAASPLLICQRIARLLCV